MLVKELYITRADGVRLYRTYSDANKMILQNETNTVYSEAIDIEDAPFTYTETDIDIEYQGGIREVDYLAALAELGVE